MMSEFHRRHTFTACARSAAVRRTARRGVVLLLCLALGLQWALVQGIAWAEMFIDFASEGSVIEAVEKTLDGQHPCPLCKKVKEGNRDSKDPQSPQEDDAVKELDAVLVSHVVLIPPAGETMNFAPLCAVMIQRNEMPEPPPPRRGLV
jgi:hypothetical protein